MVGNISWLHPKLILSICKRLQTRWLVPSLLPTQVPTCHTCTRSDLELILSDHSMETALPGPDEQERILQECKQSIKKHAFLMRKAIDDESDLREALRYSAAMLGELRTSSLSPQKYYELYMLVFDQLVNLEAYFNDMRGEGHTFTELYELVQHAGNVLPRL